MIGRIEKINKKTDIKGRAYETVGLTNKEWLINRDDSLQGVLSEGMEYDFTVETDPTGRWTNIKAITPVIDQSKPEPMTEPGEPSLDEPQVGQKTEPCSRDESIVRQVAYKVAGEAVKAVYRNKTVVSSEEGVMKTLQDYAHVIAFDILYGEKWGK